MNNKILSVVLVLGIASTGFASISSANDTGTGSVKSEMRQLFEKLKSGVTLTAEEQAQLDTAKATFSEIGGKRGFDGHGKRGGFENLTQEEKIQLQSMTDDEKKAFFDVKKSEMEAQRIEHKNVIDKLIAGQTLTADEEATRLDMIAKMQENNTDHPAREGSNIIAKLLAGDELTGDEMAELATMQAKHAEREAEKAKIDAMSDDEKTAYFEAKKVEREAQMELVKPLFEKLRNGETLTAEEQKILGENMPERGDMRGFGGGRGHGPDMDDDMPQGDVAPEATAQ